MEKIGVQLLQFFTENCRDSVLDPHTCLLALSLGQNTILAGRRRLAISYSHVYSDHFLAAEPEAKQKFYGAIAEVASEEFVPSNSESYHIVEHPQGHFLLKHLLRTDIQLHKDGHGNSVITMPDAINDSDSNVF